MKRTPGGALPLRQVATGRPAQMTIKDISVVKENYLEIARKAVSMIQNNDVVYIPSATVGLFIVQNLPDNLKIRVVTNSIVIADELRKKNEVSVIMLGEAISFWNALIDSAKKTIGLYPKEKIGFDSIVSICPANRLDTLITDWDASEEDLKLFDEKGIEVVVLDKPE